MPLIPELQKQKQTDLWIEAGLVYTCGFRTANLHQWRKPWTNGKMVRMDLNSGVMFQLQQAAEADSLSHVLLALRTEERSYRTFLHKWWKLLRPGMSGICLNGGLERSLWEALKAKPGLPWDPKMSEMQELWDTYWGKLLTGVETTQKKEVWKLKGVGNLKYIGYQTWGFTVWNFPGWSLVWFWSSISSICFLLYILEC